MNAPASHEPDWMAQYHALTTGVAVVEFAERTQIELSGTDRATFLHNLCTNNVRQLEVGAGCEAFLTTVQGKTLAHVFIFACPKSLVIDAVGGQGETILTHLDHYLISEKVTLDDRSREWTELLLAGPGSEPLLAKLGDVRIPPALLSHAAFDVAGTKAWLRRVEMTSPGGFLIVPAVKMVRRLPRHSSTREQHAAATRRSRQRASSAVFRFLARTSPTRTCRRKWAATRRPSVSSRAAISARRPSPESTRWGM